MRQRDEATVISLEEEVHLPRDRLVYWSPEILALEPPYVATGPGDVYSFAIVLVEIGSRTEVDASVSERK